MNNARKELPVLFPQPQEVRRRKGALPLMARGQAPCTIVIGEAATQAERQAAERLRQALALGGALPPIATAPSGQGMAIALGTAAGNPLVAEQAARIAAPCNAGQAYLIEVAGGRACLAANEPIGVRYAVETFCQLLDRREDAIYLPEVTIRDWPEMAYRGIYVECRWGPDLMTLADWQRAIDYLAALKLNVMSVGIHNNWPMQYDGKRSEFLLVPSRAYPELNQPKWIDYYSPLEKRWKHHQYMARMVAEDTFGQVIAYGREKGVLVRPHYNTPGHNTIIPHCIPEISSRDEAGKPTGYGFCLTNPKTYQVMYTILDEVVDRYLAPNGVDWFHLGLDEVWVARGIDENDPLKAVSPFCQCPACRGKPWEDHFVDYVVAMCKHLQAKGIRHIGMWNDSFVRGGRMNQALAERFEREGLKDLVILHWWRYHDYYDTIHPELGLKRWVTPMTGYFYWENYRDHLDNIWLGLRKGHEEGAEGCEAYGVFDRCFDRQYHCLADYAWKHDATPRLAEFREKYVQKLYGERWAEVADAFRCFDEAVRGKYHNFTTFLYYYTYAYPWSPGNAHVRANYPQAILAQLVGNPMQALGRLREIRDDLAKARAIWGAVPARDAQQVELAGILDLEAQRTQVVCDLFLRLVALLKAYKRRQERGLADRQASVDELRKGRAELAALLEELDGLMARTEGQPDAYLAPQSLRELSLMRHFVGSLGDEWQGITARLESGKLEALPELEAMACTPVDWPD